VGFVVKYGDDLVKYAIKVNKQLKAKVDERKNSKGNRTLSYLSKNSESLVPVFLEVPLSLAPLRITQLQSVYKCNSLPRLNEHGGNARALIIRQYMGLEDALFLLLASVLIILGTTAARRQIEIRTLDDDCLEKILGSGWYLRFELGKDNFNSIKGKPVRCIPNIAARAIKQIMKLNQHIRTLHGVISNKLFHGFTRSLSDCCNLSAGQYNVALDIFCDYVQVPLDNEGKRWYIREHQLRRFWAYSFFYKFGLGELDTISWYLGHTDCENTWNYIQESFIGHDKEMCQIKANYATDVLYNRINETEGNEKALIYIRELIFEHFNTGSIELVEKDELLEYLVSVRKPHFSELRYAKMTKIGQIW